MLVECQQLMMLTFKAYIQFNMSCYKYCIVFITLLLSGCISIPIPPNGENAGSLGYLTLTLGYKLPKIYSEVYNSPTIRDK